MFLADVLWQTSFMTQMTDLNQLSPEQLKALASQLLGQVNHLEQVNKDYQCNIQKLSNANKHYQALNEKLTHELAILKRHRFAKTSEALNSGQRLLFEELISSDISAIEEELAEQLPTQPLQREKQKPKRKLLPNSLPRTIIEHEPDNTHCACGCQMKRIGEDVSEKLDYTPGEFTVERHVRGKWVCDDCETITQAPVPPQVIDKGLATSGLLAHTLIAKYCDHLPLYRQEKIFGRAGVEISRSTLAEWVGKCGAQLQPLADRLQALLLEQPILHGDETPISMLAPGQKKTHKAYVWAYASPKDADLKAVVYDFSESRAGKHARAFLGDWQGQLVCDDYAGYKASVESGVTELGCMAHARRKFFELYESNGSDTAKQALDYIKLLYDIEREAKELTPAERRQFRQARSKNIVDRLHEWMLAQRQRARDGSALAKALDYSLKRWIALTRYLDDGAAPIDNNWVENQIRPWALGRKNWLFAGSLRSGKRAAAIMSLIQSAKLNGHEPYAYLKDVLNRLPTHKNSQLDELLPHNWLPAQ